MIRSAISRARKKQRDRGKKKEWWVLHPTNDAVLAYCATEKDADLFIACLDTLDDSRFHNPPYPNCQTCKGTGVYDDRSCPTCFWDRWRVAGHESRVEIKEEREQAKRVWAKSAPIMGECPECFGEGEVQLACESCGLPITTENVSEENEECCKRCAAEDERYEKERSAT